MSSALAMVLAAGMAVPGNGSEMVSGEMEQGFDLRGEWEGVWWYDSEGCFIVRPLLPCGLYGERGNLITWLDTKKMIDEGGGKLHATWIGSKERIHGIYEQDGERLLICFREAPSPRPTSFYTGEGQHLLILHRVKPRK